MLPIQPLLLQAERIVDELLPERPPIYDQLNHIASRILEIDSREPTRDPLIRVLKDIDLLTQEVRELKSSDNDVIQNLCCVCEKIIRIFQYNISTLASPFAAIAAVSRLDRPNTREACLSYILQYQHYNADYSPADRRFLTYPNPLRHVSKKPGYVRTDYGQLFPLIKPWIDRNFPKQKTSIRLGPLLTLDVLKRFLGLTIVEDINSLKTGEECFLIRVDSPKALDSCLSRYKPLRSKYPNIRLLFLFQRSGIDCCLFWGAKFRSLKKKDELDYVDLQILFGNKALFTILNQAGAVPDRLAVHRFLVHDIQGDFKAAVREIGVPDAMLDSIEVFRVDWNEKRREMGGYRLDIDSGAALYRDAILEWSRCLPLDSLEPLLSSQVAPWISEDSSITRWAKAYQNMCEIVMLYIQTHLDELKAVNLKDLVYRRLPPSMAVIPMAVGLFPYGMTSFSHIFDDVLFHTRGQVGVGCISQNYFEMLSLIEKIGSRIQLTQESHLDAFKATPQVLVADIHPNNAAQISLHENDIGSWIESRLRSGDGGRRILVLDATLNDLSDAALRLLFEKVYSLILEGRLEVRLIQSLAKLFQLGGDNFSGGLSIYLGDSQNIPRFPQAIREKEIFFSFLIDHFQGLTSRYFNKVRQNNNWMYQTLLNELPKESCVQLTFSGDSETVYVALNFKDVLNLKRVNLPQILNLILELAHQRNLPLTGRQSFGFALSNLTEAGDSLRFSVGVEDEETLIGYANLFIEVIGALSEYIATKEDPIEWKSLADTLKRAWRIVNKEESLGPYELPIVEEGFTADGNEELIEKGKTKLVFKNGRCELTVPNRQKGLVMLVSDGDTTRTEPVLETTIMHNEISLGDPRGVRYTPWKWNQTSFVQLLLRLMLLNAREMYVFYDKSYSICGFRKILYYEFDDFINPTEIVQGEKQSITLDERTFEASDGPNRYGAHQVFAVVSTLGTSPVSVDRFQESHRHEVFTKCMTYHFRLEPHPTISGSIVIRFLDRKQFLNYFNEVKKLYFKDTTLTVLVNYLNQNENFKQLPLPHDLAWGRRTDVEQSIAHNLRLLGKHLATQITHDIIDQIYLIRSSRWKSALIEGIREGFISGSLDGKTALRDESTFETLFGEHKIPFMNDIDGWVHDMVAHLKKRPDDLSRVVSYIRALFPVIKNRFKTATSLLDIYNSIPLHSLAQMVIPCLFESQSAQFPELKIYLNNLVIELVACDKKSLDGYIGFYIRYPLSPDQKQSLMITLGQVDNEKRLKWIQNPDFYFYSLDKFDIRMVADPEDTVLYDEDVEAIRHFFTQTGCKEALIKCLRTNQIEAPTARRWVEITGDADMKRALLEIRPDLMNPVNSDSE